MNLPFPVGRGDPVPLHTSKTVAEFLTGHFGGSISDVSAIGAGEWSQAFAFRRKGCDYIIRFSRFAEDFAKDRLAAGFASSRLPVPRIVDTGEALGGFYAVSERVFGEPLDGLGQARLCRTLPSLLETLDAIRGVDVSGTTGFGAWRGDGAGPHANWRAALLDVAEDRPADRVPAWRARLVDSATGEGALNSTL